MRIIDDVSYEFRKPSKKTEISVSSIDISKCTSDVLNKTPVSDWKIYHLSDKNQFWFDFKGERYYLNVFGSGEGETPTPSINLSEYAKKTDLSEYAKKTDLPIDVSQLTNNIGYITNADLSTEINKQIPTKVSQLTNDKGYITNVNLSTEINKLEIPTKVSQLTNDSGYITNVNLSTEISNLKIPTKLSELVDDTEFITYDDLKKNLEEYTKGEEITKPTKVVAKPVSDSKTTIYTNIVNPAFMVGYDVEFEDIIINEKDGSSYVDDYFVGLEDDLQINGVIFDGKLIYGENRSAGFVVTVVVPKGYNVKIFGNTDINNNKKWGEYECREKIESVDKVFFIRKVDQSTLSTGAVIKILVYKE